MSFLVSGSKDLGPRRRTCMSRTVGWGEARLKIHSNLVFRVAYADFLIFLPLFLCESIVHNSGHPPKHHYEN